MLRQGEGKQALKAKLMVKTSLEQLELASWWPTVYAVLYLHVLRHLSS